MVISSTDIRIDIHIDIMARIMKRLNEDYGFESERAAMLAVAIQQNLILEEALLAAQSEIPQPLEKIAIVLEEIGQSEILNYMPED